MYICWADPACIRVGTVNGASIVSNNSKMQIGKITARNMTGNMGENMGQKFCKDMGRVDGGGLLFLLITVSVLL